MKLIKAGEIIFESVGTTVFQEGDKICFCYVILQGRVSFNQINAQTKRNEELGVKFAGLLIRYLDSIKGNVTGSWLETEHVVFRNQLQSSLV